MGLEELIMIIETYGSDVRRWPEEKRGEAERLLLTSSEAQSALSQARELDDLLSRYVVADAEDHLIRKIVVENTQAANKSSMFYFFNPFLNPSLALAVLVFCLIFGFVVGFLDGFTTIQPPADSATLLLNPIEVGAI